MIARKEILEKKKYMYSDAATGSVARVRKKDQHVWITKVECRIVKNFRLDQ